MKSEKCISLLYSNSERMDNFLFKAIFCTFDSDSCPLFLLICLVSFLFLSFVDQFKDLLFHLHAEKMKLSKKEQMNNYKTRECKCGYQLIIEPCLIKCNYQSLSCVKKNVRVNKKNYNTLIVLVNSYNKNSLQYKFELRTKN